MTTWSRVASNGKSRGNRVYHAWQDGKTLCGRSGPSSPVARSVQPHKACRYCVGEAEELRRLRARFAPKVSA